MKLIKDRGIILKTIKSGDTSLQVRIFSRDGGRMSIIAKGARKPVSAFFGHLNPFSVIDYEYATGNGKYIAFLRSVSEIENFTDLSRDPAKIVYASILLEITDKTSQPHEDVETLRLLYLTLKTMKESDIPPEQIHWWFIVHFLKIHGVWPDPDHCSNCRKLLKQAVLIMDSGGLYCHDCASLDAGNGLTLNTPMLQIMSALTKNDIRDIRIQISNKKTAVTMSKWLWKLLSIHYEETENLKSIKAIETLL
ncbi:MAG TPA: DNA repair protein RecO [Candidatus Marinimicrobia bacterium]|nr:DNA repair protein RecO [Candidatus Neomarinimicrobiota bacterium]